MKWFKFYGQDYISDPKMLSLTAEERSCWITILSYSSVNDNGKITFLSEHQLMLQAGMDLQDDCWDRTVGVLDKLQKLGMITLDNGMITIINWEKRQETNLTSYERVKRYREKKRNDNAMITLEENRIDKKRREKREDTPAQIAKSFFEGGKYYEDIREEMGAKVGQPILDEELKKFNLYWTEPNKSGTRVRWEQQDTFDVRRRLVNWFSKITQFKNKTRTVLI